MCDDPGDSGYRYYMSLGLPAALLGVLLILSLAIQVVLSSKAHQQLAPVNLQLSRMVRMQSLNLELQRDLLESLDNKDVLSDEERAQMRARLETALAMQGPLPRDAGDPLSAARDLLADAAIPSEEALILALS